MPKISVIIPVYNSEKYLAQCFDSVLNQTMQDFEAIVVNDGSTDGSEEIVNNYKPKFKNKMHYICQENAGQSGARNKALGVATGEYIFFLDSDDYLDCSAFEVAYDYAVQNDLDIVCFNFYEAREGESAFPIDYRLCYSDNVVKKYILNEASPCNKIIKREIFEKNNLRFSEKLIYEDLELVPQLALYTDKIGFIDKPLYYYVIHSGSTMRQKSYNPKLASIYKVAQTLKEKFINTEYTEELEFLYIEHLLHSAVIRFLEFEEGKADIKRISDIIRDTFPKWRGNKYYKAQSIKYKIVCNLAYYRAIFVLKKLLKIK